MSDTGDVWSAIDFETANSHPGSVCSVGLVRICGGEIVARSTTVVRPPRPVDWFARFNIEFHGITPAHVADAPEWPEVFDHILDFAAGAPLVAHNATFDMGVIRSACAQAGLSWPELPYTCSLATARRVWRDLPDYKLPTVCARIGHELLRHHSADADAEAAAQIMLAALAEHGVSSLPELAARTGALLRTLPAGTASAAPGPAAVAPSDRFARWREESRAPLPAPDPGADPSGPLYGRTVCVSGELRELSKLEAWQRIAAAGGHPAKNVTRRTDVLVIGAATAAKTEKQRRAETYAAKGQDIAIVTEATFLADLLASPSRLPHR
ncbi:exonuclease domain-containing protein [Salinactinospora qingdaonensis]|uniref:BRCT domain-containing protein n=1 Tax=Salinactinospora qingdaonensis TaxID=702744 RepID=A0ABP7F2U7_9ACTN